MSLRRLLACAIVSLFLAHAAAAQSDDFGVWLGVFANGKLPATMNDSAGHWRLWLDLQARFGDDASRFSQGIVRPGVGYSLSRAWTVWLGYAWIQTDPPYASSTTYERRIWEQASWSGTLGTTRISSRTRLEQRFVSTGSETGWRVREMAKLVQPLGKGSIWRGVLYDEYFYNLNSTNYGASAGPDRNRFFLGPGIALGQSVVAEFGYLNQYTFRTNAPDKSEAIFAVSLFWSF